jgi:hypothetical protein
MVPLILEKLGKRPGIKKCPHCGAKLPEAAASCIQCKKILTGNPDQDVLPPSRFMKVVFSLTRLNVIIFSTFILGALYFISLTIFQFFSWQHHTYFILFLIVAYILMVRFLTAER